MVAATLKRIVNTAKRLRASEIARSLTNQLEDVPSRLGQSDIHMYPDEIRIGANDHISIVRRDGHGKRRGWWTDFKADKSGTDMLDYAAHVLGCGISRDFVGLMDTVFQMLV